MIYPNYNDYLKNRTTYSSIPIYTKFKEDYFTPIAIFEKLRTLSPNFLLESAGEHQENGRYSYIGVNSKNISNNFKNLKDIEEHIEHFSSYTVGSLPPFYNGFIGYLSYESVKELHSVAIDKKSDIPIFQVLFTELIVVIDHHLNEISVIYNTDSKTVDEYNKACEIIETVKSLIQTENVVMNFKQTEKPTISIKSNMTKPEYVNMVNKAKDYIVAGDIFQVVLSQKFTVECDITPFELYKGVRRENPSPYLSYIEFDDMVTICSSPELLVKNNNGVIETAPIAGTRAVKNDGKDKKRADELLSDQKELAEHLMLVDLGRNDIGKISVPGSVEVDSFCKVKKYSKVMHLVSNVKGTLRESETTLSPLVSTFPAGTVSGSPKIRAMEIIDELEPENRNLYAGSIFYLNSDGNFNSCIAIRTIMIKDSIVTFQSGGGIVHDSKPDDEYLETLNKARALFNALENSYEGDVNYDFDYR